MSIWLNRYRQITQTYKEDSGVAITTPALTTIDLISNVTHWSFAGYDHLYGASAGAGTYPDLSALRWSRDYGRRTAMLLQKIKGI